MRASGPQSQSDCSNWALVPAPWFESFTFRDTFLGPKTRDTSWALQPQFWSPRILRNIFGPKGPITGVLGPLDIQSSGCMACGFISAAYGVWAWLLRFLGLEVGKAKMLMAKVCIKP